MSNNSAEKWCVIVNPASGYGSGLKKFEAVKTALHEASVPHDTVFTAPDSKADDKVIAAISDGYRRFVCVGGDGHLQDMVNGILSQQIVDSSEVTICMVSTGTGNDWIKTPKVPSQPADAVALIKKGKTICQNVGKIGYIKKGDICYRYFVNFAGVGFDAYVVNRTKSYKKIGALGYLMGMAACLFSYKQPIVKVSFDGKDYTQRIYMAMAGIGSYGGGGMYLFPNASLTADHFNVVIIGQISILKILLNIFKLYNGKLHQLREVSYHHSSKIMIQNLDHTHSLFMEADGEEVGEGPFELTLLKNKINILVP